MRVLPEVRRESAWICRSVSALSPGQEGARPKSLSPEGRGTVRGPRAIWLSGVLLPRGLAFLLRFKWGWHIAVPEGWQIVLNVTSSGHGTPLCSGGDGEVALAWPGSLGTPTGLVAAADPW